jgi:DNA modification methylase
MPLRPYFQKDGITLYHGDAREILPELQPETFDMVLTDPPYLVSYSGRWGSDLGVIQGDSDSSWVQPVFSEIWRLLKPDSLCFSFYGWQHAETFLFTWKGIGFRPVSLIALIKDRWGLGQFTRAQHETAYLLAKGRPRKPDAAISDVIHWEQPSPQLHPNQKPLGAISKVVHTYTAQRSIILDPFCGSGTTLVAARNLGRHAVGIEIEECFCELSALRLSQEVFDFDLSPDELSPVQMQLIGDTMGAEEFEKGEYR